MNYYDSCHGNFFHPGGISLTNYLLELSGLKPPAQILDIGCGTGETVSALREQGYSSYGIDPSPSMSKEHPFLFPYSAEQILFPDHSFDALLYECVFSLFHDPSVALLEASRLLKENGLILMSDVYTPLEDTVASGALKYLYTKETLYEYLSNAGFTVTLFEDRTEDLITMVAQYILEGRESELCEDFSSLQKYKCRYFLLTAEKSTCK